MRWRLAGLILLFTGALSASSQAPFYGRLEFQLQNAQGQALSGATINVYTQSQCGQPSGALATLYPSANAGSPLTQPLHTNGFGEAHAYAVAGCYTVVYSSPSTGTVTRPDQLVGQSGPAGAAGATGPTGPAGPTFDGGTIHNPLIGTSGTFSGTMFSGAITAGTSVLAQQFATTDANDNYFLNGSGGPTLAGYLKGVFIGTGAGAAWGKTRASYSQSGTIAIGKDAFANAQTGNAGIVIGWEAAKGFVSSNAIASGEDFNTICIGDQSCYTDTGDTIGVGGIHVSGEFENVVIGHRAYMYGTALNSSVIIGTHIYSVSGQLNQTGGGGNSVWIGGNISNSMNSSLITTQSDTYVGANIFSPTTPPTPSTYATKSQTIIGAGSGSCFYNTWANTLIGANISPNASCPSAFNGIGNVYIAGGKSWAGGQTTMAPNWTSGNSNFVMSGQMYGGAGSIGGNISTGNGNVLIGGGTGAAILDGSLLTAIGNGACASTFHAGPTNTNDVCVGASSDTGATVLSATALGAGAIANANGTVQLGVGTNSTANTLQFQTKNFLDSSGNATFAKLTTTGGSPTFDSMYAVSAVTSAGVSTPGALTAGALSNYIGYSDLLTHTGWSAIQGTATVTENSLDVPPPYASTQVNKLVFPSGLVQYGYTNAAAPVVAGTNYTVCAWMRGASGGEVINFLINQNTFTTFTLTTSWQYLCTPPLASGGGFPNRSFIFYSGLAQTIYSAGVATVLAGNPSVYLAVNTGTPVSTPVLEVNVPFLTAGPVSYDGTTLKTPAFNQAALVSGTVTVSNAAACVLGAACNYKLTNCGPAGTAIGVPSLGTVSAGVSFVINSISATNTVVTGDTSTVCWQIN